jgi:hypothetical protein
MATINTTDLQLAAFLRASGYELARLEGPEYKRTFVFDGVPAELQLDFYENKPIGNVGARKLFHAYFDLKRLVFMSAQVKM